MLTVGQGVVEWVEKRLGCAFPPSTGIGWQEGGELVAGVAYNDFNGVNICMHVAAVPGKRWMRREYLKTCFDYPFNQLGVKRITGWVAEGNKEARKFDEHLGFVLETTLSDAHPTGNLLVYVMRRQDCRWLGESDERLAA